MSKYNDILVTTPYGKWIWWPNLQVVEFTPKGKRTVTKWEFLYTSEQEEAFEKIVKREAKDLRKLKT